MSGTNGMAENSAETSLRRTNRTHTGGGTVETLMRKNRLGGQLLIGRTFGVIWQL